MKKTDDTNDKYNVESTSAGNLDGCATTEATGLMYRPPVSGAELASYKDIFPFSPDEYVKKDTNPGEKPDFNTEN